MSQPSENLRVRRTRKLLREALVELVDERGFDRLTVGEITTRAMVSRAAFYRSYRDKFDLVEQIFDEAMTALRDVVADGDQPARSTGQRWEAFFAHIDTYHGLYGALLGTKGSSWFAARMRAALTEMVEDHLEPQPNTLPAAVLGALFVQSITWWLENDRPSPPSQIAEQSARLAGAVITEANRTRSAPRTPRPARR